MQTNAELPEAATALENGRIAPRHRVLKSAKIVMDDWTAYDCQLRDLSSTGAKIRINNPVQVPNTFRLYISAEGSIRDVRVTWKDADVLGVTFTSDAKPCSLRKF